MKLSKQFNHTVNEFFAGALEGIAKRIVEIKGPVAPRTAEYQAEVLREAAHIIRANRDLASPKETTE